MAQFSDRADVVKALEAEVEKAGGVKALAPKYGVTPTYMYLVLSGHKEPGPSVLEPLGFMKVRAYRKVSP